VFYPKIKTQLGFKPTPELGKKEPKLTSVGGFQKTPKIRQKDQVFPEVKKLGGFGHGN